MKHLVLRATVVLAVSAACLPGCRDLVQAIDSPPVPVAVKLRTVLIPGGDPEDDLDVPPAALPSPETVSQLCMDQRGPMTFSVNSGQEKSGDDVTVEFHIPAPDEPSTPVYCFFSVNYDVEGGGHHFAVHVSPQGSDDLFETGCDAAAFEEVSEFNTIGLEVHFQAGVDFQPLEDGCCAEHSSPLGWPPSCQL